MTKFRVFVGAPSHSALQQPKGRENKWRTVSSTSSEPSIILPPATLEAASRRISLLYQNIIFHDKEGEGRSYDEQDEESGEVQQNSEYANSISLISWPPTGPEGSSYLHSYGPETSFDASVSYGQFSSFMQETQEMTTNEYSDASSIVHFPTFHFNLHTLTSLSFLTANQITHKVSLLLAILEVEGPDSVRLKKGLDAGKEVSILKMIMGDADGQVCKLTAWREVADAWGGYEDSPKVKRGDVVWIQNVRASYEPSSAIALTASPFFYSRLEICYRTMPNTHEDGRLRPDLRLGASDAGVKKVEALVKWFEEMAGLVVERH